MAPQVTREQALAMLDELIAHFNTAEVQQKLRELWDSATDHLEKIRLRQEFCLGIQGPIIEKYGYKASAAGVSKSSSQIMSLMKGDSLLTCKGTLNNWLVARFDWEMFRYDHNGAHVDDAALQIARFVFKVSVTNASDTRVVKAVEQCRGELVRVHQALYETEYPGIRPNEWLDALGRETVRQSLEQGMLVLHAEHQETGQVVGYISCTLGADEEQFLGAWACSGEPGYQIARDRDGQLRVEGAFAIGSGSGVLTPHGSWLEARLWSGADGRRLGTVRFSVSEPGSMVCGCRASDEAEWRSAVAHGVGQQSRRGGPFAKINHVVVMPKAQGHGVARLLFEELHTHLCRCSPAAAADLRLSVVDANTRSISWYFKLGFRIVEVLPAKLATLKLGHVPVVFLTMQRRRHEPASPWHRFFGREVCGERLVLLPDGSPVVFLSLAQMRVMPLPFTNVRSFDQASGVHLLEDGRTLDLTAAFSCGLAYFERPLHTALARAPGK